MAGDWIKMRADLHDDPAVFRLQKILSIDRFSVVGRLHAFWSWCDKHASNGYVTGAPLTLVDEVVTLNGFADALVLVGWLELDADRGLRIPNFERHNGKPAKERALTNQRVRNHRERNADVTEKKRLTVTREEKRREEVKQDKPPDGGPLWGECLAILTEQGHSEKTARSFLGSLLRDYEEAELIDAVRASVGAANATSYIRGVLKKRPRRGEGEVKRLAI